MQFTNRRIVALWAFPLVLAALTAAPASAYTFTTLATFTGGTNGATPLGPLALNKGTLYGTTSAGAKGYGTVFAIVPGHHLRTLYTFCSQNSCSDGTTPRAGLILDTSGDLYGTTFGGGAHSSGTVFEVTPSGKESVLYSFCAVVSNDYCADGSSPVSTLARDSAGDLYGTTLNGGANDKGVVFELTYDSASSSWKEMVLYSFCAKSNCADGASPLAGVSIHRGTIYGTAQLGGANAQGGVFSLDSAGRERVLYSFCSLENCADGSEPNAPLIRDSAGTLYGTTKYGGNPNCGDGGGIVFSLSGTTETVLHKFCSAKADKDGSYPVAGLFEDSGNLYGTAETGGASSQGVLFEVMGTTETVLHSFCSATTCGKNPAAGVVVDSAGNIFGTTSAGGRDDDGTVYELEP